MEIARTGNLVVIGLGPDEPLLESIQAVIEKEGIRGGVVISGTVRDDERVCTR